MTAAEPRAARRAFWSVFLLLLGLYTACFTGLPDNPDAEVEFQTTSSLARTGSLALGGTPEAEAILAARFDVAPGGPARAGQWFSWFGVGQAAVGLPFYALGAALARCFPAVQAEAAQLGDYGVARSEYFEHLCVGWRNPLLSAWTAALIVAAALRLGARARSAWLVGIAYGLASFALAQARSTLSDVQAAACLMLAFERLLAARERWSRGQGARAALFVFGAALGLAVLTRVFAAPAAALIALAPCVLRARAPAAARRPSLVELGCALLPALACALIFAAVNRARFGHWLDTGYGSGVGADFFAYPIPYGLAGLAISPGKGLLWLAPALVAWPFAWRALRARGEALARWLPWLVLLAIALPVSAMQGWHAGYTFGPRYLLPALPLVWCGLASALEAARTRLAKAACALLFAFGLASNLPAALIDTMTYHDAAVQAARTAWPLPETADARAADEQRFLLIAWDWRFAAPWAHWRLFAAQLRAPGSDPDARVFGLPPAPLPLAHERERGFRHLAWVQHAELPHARAWPGWAFAALCAAAGLLLARPAQGARRIGR